MFQIIERGRAQEDDSRKSTQFESFSRKQGGEGFHRELLSQLKSESEKIASRFEKRKKGIDLIRSSTMKWVLTKRRRYAGITSVKQSTLVAYVSDIATLI